jgi:sigma-B regulation protein RsbU (phosphoserine phosphatase)
MFITLFCCSIDSHYIVYINAGHEPPILYSKTTDRFLLLESKTPFPVGIMPNLSIEISIEAFEPGSLLLAVTDGVSESPHFSRIHQSLFRKRNFIQQYLYLPTILLKQS